VVPQFFKTCRARCQTPVKRLRDFSRVCRPRGRSSLYSLSLLLLLPLH
jgi:hypothetical protein